MGALHEGHRELIRHARRIPGAGVTVVSIFVNPLQFGPNEDLARYPRPLEADLAACREEGVELVFPPGVADMYPEGADTAVSPAAGHRAGGRGAAGPLRRGAHGGAEALPHRRPGRRVLRREGLPAARPRQEDGARPGLPALHRRRPDVREPDGLALSSRNVYLSAEERRRAPRCTGGAAAGRRVGRAGPRPCWPPHAPCSPRSRRWPSTTWSSAPPTSAPPRRSGRARLLVAARVGATRLIDNIAVRL